MNDRGVQTFLEKAEESLATAESEFANRRFNSCANRCYYASFQAAVAALMRAGVQPSRATRQWDHWFVQAEFAGLIARRKLYSPSLRDALPRLISLRHSADYTLEHVSETQAGRALRRARDLVDAVRRGGESR